MRDDFNKLAKDIVAKRVGLHCSNPNCRRLTFGPNSLEQKTTNIGVAAHITAASPNGPRYDQFLSSEERSSIANAIWLCQSCAKLIDSDPIRYSVDIISTWKSDAEKETELELTQIRQKKEPKDYNNVFALMPDLINEIINDLEENPLMREFILLKKGWSYNSGGKKFLAYYYEEHPELDDKIRLLENNGLITDITYNNTKRYVLSEDFVEIVRNTGKMTST